MSISHSISQKNREEGTSQKQGQALFGILATISYINSLVKDGDLAKHEGRVFVSELTNMAQNYKEENSSIILKLNTLIDQLNSSLEQHLHYPLFQLNNISQNIENFCRYLYLINISSEEFTELQNQTESIVAKVKQKEISCPDAMKKLGGIIEQVNQITVGQGAYPIPNPEYY